MVPREMTQAKFHAWTIFLFQPEILKSGIFLTPSVGLHCAHMSELLDAEDYCLHGTARKAQKLPRELLTNPQIPKPWCLAILMPSINTDEHPLFQDNYHILNQRTFRSRTNRSAVCFLDAFSPPNRNTRSPISVPYSGNDTKYYHTIHFF